MVKVHELSLMLNNQAEPRSEVGTALDLYSRGFEFEVRPRCHAGYPD
jgi:hypothetical protein